MLMRRRTAKRTIYRFTAMASPCTVQFDELPQATASRLGELAEAEAKRIESKYSRYRDDNIIAAINRSNGTPVALDAETRLLLEYAGHCYALSEGLFDITSGVLRRAWKFDGSDRVPARKAVEAVLPFVGWNNIQLNDEGIALSPGMEIDLGGIGKEYAVDRVLLMLAAETDAPLLVNFGGDLRVSGPLCDGKPWRIAIENTEEEEPAASIIDIGEGALTTSGDAKRFLLKDGVRYSHILDPRTGWPVSDPPRSVTVAAATCMEAGIFSTLAMAKGKDAESFLADEHRLAWVIR